jgi:hypothetical protein
MPVAAAAAAVYILNTLNSGRNISAAYGEPTRRCHKKAANDSAGTQHRPLGWPPADGNPMAACLFSSSNRRLVVVVAFHHFYPDGGAGIHVCNHRDGGGGSQVGRIRSGGLNRLRMAVIGGKES